MTAPRAARRGGEFFARPQDPTQRRYEALRAYLLDGLPATEVADRFGYTPAAVQSLVRDFRAGQREFFRSGRPGPKSAPAKEAARERILQLRAAGHSIDEIRLALAEEGIALNRTGIAEVIAAEGLPRLWRRRDAERGGPRRETLPRAEVADFAALAGQAETRVAGLLLAIPDLVALDLPALVQAAGYPSTAKIPATSYLLSLLALKLVGVRRVSHVEDLAAGLAAGEEINLDFHAVMHWGEDPALEKHYVPRRSQRTRSVLTFFAEDADSHTLLYANADLSKANQANEVLAFADHWKTVSGRDPGLLIFDSKVTTQAQLAELDDRGIGFLTLRARSPKLTAALRALPASAWKSLTVARAGAKTRKVKVHEDPAARLTAYPGTVRQLAVTGLGHDEPTILITNDPDRTHKALIERYAQRMNIEQRLAEAIRSFGLDALAGAVPLNIDLDVVLSVLAHTVCAALRRRLPGYATATPDTLQRRFLHTGGIILNRGNQIVVRLNRRAYSPVLRQADLPTVTVPWWGDRQLRYEFA